MKVRIAEKKIPSHGSQFTVYAGRAVVFTTTSKVEADYVAAWVVASQKKAS